MSFDFSKIINEEMKKAEAANNVSNGGYKTLYPFANGRFELKLIGCEKSNMIYRELTFHEQQVQNGKIKIPCLHAMYGEKCPICDMVSKVQDVTGDQNVFRKYGYKKRGIMFAKLVNVEPANYFGDNNNPPKPGEVVLFMFPKSLINNLRETILEYSDNLESLCASNESNVVTLKVSTGTNGFPQYNLYVKNLKDAMFKDENGDPDSNAYNEFITNLPDLSEMKFPSKPNEQIMNNVRALVEEINNNYFGGSVNVEIKPLDSSNGDEPSETNVWPNNKVKTDELNNVNNESNETLSMDKPECYMHNRYDDECAKCPFESTCI